MAMITSATDAAWPLDVGIKDLKNAGLNVECAVRFKLFTLDQRLVLRKAGTLGTNDQKRVTAAIKTLLVA
jgi:mRNA interferase MazF